MIANTLTFYTENSGYFAIALAFLVFGKYWHHYRDDIELKAAIAIILGCQGTLGSISICVKAIVFNRWGMSQYEQIFLFIGCVAAFWTAVVSLKRVVSKPAQPATVQANA
jgi:hypothetical protein